MQIINDGKNVMNGEVSFSWGSGQVLNGIK